MDIGMLWYDDDHKRSLNERVSRAVDYYKTKYGVVPTVCFVNPATLKDGPESAAGVQLRSARNVLVDHFWLGVGEAAGHATGKHQSHARANGGGRALATAPAAKA
jgi:hypothetical protein